MAKKTAVQKYREEMRIWRPKFIEVEKQIIEFFRRHPDMTPDGSFTSNIAHKFAMTHPSPKPEGEAKKKFEQGGSNASRGIN